MFKKLFTLRAVTSQRGAMFSMDARIALIIASVLAGVVGTQIIQRIERNKVAAAEQGVAQLMEGLKNYYTTVSLNTVPSRSPPRGFGDFESDIVDEGLVAQDNLKTDPWGKSWKYDECSRNATIEGSDVTVHHVVIFSDGPDDVDDSTAGPADNNFLTDGSCASDYTNWSAQEDDIGEKFSTFDIERKRVEITREHLNSIREALGAYESSKFMEAENACSGGSLPAYCGSPVDGDEYNFFPQSINDGTSASYFIPDGRLAVPGDEMDVVNNTSANMQNFVVMLGLNSNLAQDPWGRTLCYESNRTGRGTPPFSGKVSYVEDISLDCPTP